jgi:hypothetical protein
MKKTAAILIITGVVIAIFGESRPVINDVFGAFDEPAKQVEFIRNAASDWKVSQLGIGIGGLITAIGLGLFGREIPKVSENSKLQSAGIIAGGLAVLGGLAHAVSRYSVSFQSPEEAVSSMGNGDWTGPVYSIFTRVAILLFGFLMVKSGYSVKMGWVTLVLGLLIFVLFPFGGPPAFNNLVILVIGLSLLFKRSA